MKRIFLHVLPALFLLLAANAVTAQTTIFDYASSWKYLDDGSNQGTAWTATTFNDATWASDTGFFGYGDTWITKLVNACGTITQNPSCGNKYITTYFRKVVNIPSTAIYDSVIFNVKRDDGVVIYVNGVEVMRDPNLPTGTMTYTTTATTALGGVDEYTPITKKIPVSYFTNGNNTIAVEVHQQSGTSSDLGFNMQMIATPSLTIFPYDDAWKYFTTATDAGTAWRATTFNDASWSTGTGHIGFGETWTTTCIPAGATGCAVCPAVPGSCTKYTTTYFRKNINIANPAIYDSMKFSVFRDDGIVMYINGTEVWRDNMPTGTISYSTFAPNNINGTTGAYAESLAVAQSIPISAFVAGSNTIAVEVHQNSATSSDLDFDVQMTAIPHVAVVVPPATPVTLSQGPYLQMGNKTGVNVRWRTNIASKSKVEVGTVLGTYPIVVSDTVLKTDHEIRVASLNPDTKYYYRIGTDTSVTQGDTSNFFTTAPQDTSTRRVTLAVFGDCGRNDNNFQTGSLSAYQNYIASKGVKAADIMMLVGDNAYNNGTDAEYTTNFFNRYSGNVLKNHMLFPAPGNHEYDNGSAARQADHNIPYYSLFTMPQAAECGGVASGTKAYYSFDWGANVHVLSLDSYGKEDAGTTRLYDTTGAQVQWVKNDLAANNKKWVIVYFHHPPYTMGSHNSDAEAELVSIRQNFIRILERYGVDMVICGHSHDYERSYLLKGYYGNEASFNKAAHTTDTSSGKYDGTTNSCPYTTPSGKVNHGTVYVVSGSSGADDGIQAGYPHDALPFSIDDGGMFYIDIKDNRLDAKFLRKDNTIGDQFTIMKDTKVKDTVKVFPGTALNLKASWPGSYAWNTGATSQVIAVSAPAKDTTFTVKDSVTHTCLTDQHFVNVLCTTPAFTSCPVNIISPACNSTVTYSVADTGTATPTLTYAFTGATTGTGTGSGSGATFNTGVTNVTVTATNGCGSVNCNFTVTVPALPATPTATGGGAYCNNTVIRAANGHDGTIYFQGFTSGGTSTAVAADTAIITATGTYYFRARSSAGCWSTQASVSVTINPLPAPVNVSGAGSFCDQASLAATGGAGGSMYFQSTVSGGTSTVTQSALATVTNTGTYYFRSRSSAGCWSQEGSANIYIYPKPAAITVTGGGAHCDNTTLAASNGGDGTIYFQGLTSGGTSTSVPFTSVRITTSGTYYFRAKSAVGCWGNEIATSVVINPLPTVHNVIGGGHYCSGDAGVNIGLNGSDTGVGYQLLYGSSNMGGMVSGTGSAISMGSQTNAGSYTIVAVNNTTGCSANMTGSASISIDPLPTDYTVTGSGSYCAGDAGLHVGLSASNTGITYQLYNGTTMMGAAKNGINAALDLGLQTAAGTYTVIARNTTTNCARTMSTSATISINPLPTTQTVMGGGAYCAGDTGVHVTLSGSESAISYNLYKGTSLVSTIAGSGSFLDFGARTAAGTYKVIAVNPSTTCAASMTASATVSVNPLPAAHTITGGGRYCADGNGMTVDLNGSETGIHYQLYNGASPVGTFTRGTNAPIGFGKQLAAGNYTVTAMDTATGCTSAMAGVVMISIDPTPVVYAVTGGGHYCASGTGVHVKLAGSATGINYQLYNGSTPVGGLVAGTSTALDFGLQTATGAYSVKAKNALTACGADMSSSVPVVIDPLPAIFHVTGGGSFCADGLGVKLGISGSEAKKSYQLYNAGVKTGAKIAGTDSVIDLGYNKTSGSYTIVARDTTTGCTVSMKDTATVISIPVVIPSLYNSADRGSHVCSGDLVTYTTKPFNEGTSPIYKWSVNGVDQAVYKSSFILYPKDGDNIIATLISNATCATPKTVTSGVTMKVDDIVFPTVAVSATPSGISAAGQKVTLKATSTNGGDAPIYQWYVNNAMAPGATSATYVSTELSVNDSVSCVITRGDACARYAIGYMVMRPAPLNVNEVGGMNDIVVSPNPNKGAFNVHGSLSVTTDTKVTLEITDMLGQVVYKREAIATNGNINERLKMGNAAPGIYLLSVKSASEQRVFHLVIEQ